MAIPQKGCRRMIKKITYGAPFDTEAVTGAYESWQGELPYFPRKREENFPTGWRRRMLYSALGKMCAESISAAGFMKANAAMIRTTGRTNALFTAPIISL